MNKKMIKITGYHWIFLFISALSIILLIIFRGHIITSAAQKVDSENSHHELSSEENKKPVVKNLSVLNPSLNVFKNESFLNSNLNEEFVHEEINEKAVKEEFLLNAKKMAKSTEDKEKIIGARYLRNFPDTESEVILSNLIMYDDNSDVRLMAVFSLATIKSPMDSTISVLMNSLYDESSEVRGASFSTIQSYIYESEESAYRDHWIYAELKYRASNTELPEDIRGAILEALHLK